MGRKYEDYSGRFPEEIQKEEIQQWRQARSRPGEKETHNIKSREKNNMCWKSRHSFIPPRLRPRLRARLRPRPRVGGVATDASRGCNTLTFIAYVNVQLVFDTSRQE